MDQKDVLDMVVKQFESVTGKQWMDFDPDKNGNMKRDSSVTVEDELKLFRGLMSLMKFKLEEESKKAISYNLSLLLIQDCGLLKLIMAVFDLDESSQKVTTLDQRFMAVSNVVCFIPYTCVSFHEYLERLSPQIHSLFLNKTGKTREQKLMYLRKIATHIINGMITRKKNYAIKSLINPVIDQFLKDGDTRTLSLNDCLDILYGLTITNFDLKHFLPLFSNIFYARCVLDESISTKKTKLNVILQEMMRRIDHSIYMLDDCLFNHFHIVYFYDIRTNERDGSRDLRFRSQGNKTEEVDLKIIDTITVVASEVTESSLQNESKVDLCIHLLDRLSMVNVMKPSQGLLLCSFLSTLQERIQDLFVQFPTKFIRFVVTTLNRNSSTQVPRINPEDESNLAEKEEQVLSSLHNDSTSVAIQILKVIVSERDKLDREGVTALKECVDSLEKVIQVVKAGNKETSEVLDVPSLGEVLDVTSLIRLKEEISELDPDRCCERRSKKESLAQALRELNDPLMPTRAHALVTIKHLILGRDPETLDEKDRLIQSLQSAVADEESYIYLLAVHALAALALTQTDHLLPVLIRLYLDDDRTIQERINLGEALLQLIKNLGDFAAYYSRPLIDCFYSGITHQEPIIRTSSISNLGQLCSILKYSLKPHINQIMIGIKCLIQTETDLQVKRSAIMFLHLLLNGLDSDCIQVISDQLPEIYRLVKLVYTNSLDDVMQLHAQLAYEQLDRIGRQLLTPKDGDVYLGRRKKNLIQVLD